MKNDFAGRSMIEMMGVLTIVGALSVGGIAGYSRAMRQNKANKSIEQISVISGHLSTIGANGGNYFGMSNKSAIKLKAVLPEMKTSETTLKNPFGGEVVISAGSLMKNSSGNNVDNQAYSITYKGLDNSACIAIATNDWGNAKNSSLIGVAVGLSSSMAAAEKEYLYMKCPGHEYNLTFNVVVGCNNGSVKKLPLTVKDATQACSECRNNANCAVMLKYY